jgi:hypothetical protein
MRVDAPPADAPGQSTTAPAAPRRLAHFCLLKAVRTIIRADSDPARQALFTHVVQSRATVRMVYRLHELLARTPASALLVSCYGLAALLRIEAPRNRTARILAVAGHENAQHEVGRLIAWVGDTECAWVRLRVQAAIDGLRHAWAMRRGFRRALRLVGAIDRRYGFLVACRSAAALAWYARGRMVLVSHRCGAVLVSSEANPEEAGFVGAARALGIPQVFISHAYPTAFSPPLDFSLSILEGDAALEAHRQKGPVSGQVLLAGIEGHSAPLDPRRFERPNPVVGIFPPKAFSWETLAAIIEDCRRHVHARQIVIRWHPSMLEAPRLGHVLADRSDIVESPRGAPLPDVAALCDWVVAGENSNVHLPVLKLGIPTVSVKGLGLYQGNRADLYGFVAHGIVFPPVASIREVRPDALAAFFTQGWSSRFARYDAWYLRSRTEIGSEVRRAIMALVERSPS